MSWQTLLLQLLWGRLEYTARLFSRGDHSPFTRCCPPPPRYCHLRTNQGSTDLKVGCPPQAVLLPSVNPLYCLRDLRPEVSHLSGGIIRLSNRMKPQSNGSSWITRDPLQDRQDFEGGTSIEVTTRMPSPALGGSQGCVHFQRKEGIEVQMLLLLNLPPLASARVWNLCLDELLHSFRPTAKWTWLQS